MIEKKFILYGAASIGDVAKDALEECGLDIVGYIDRRFYEIPEFHGLPVWSIDSIPNIYSKSVVAIYVSVKNVFEHEAIARDLHKRGYNYILYKPYSVLLGKGSEKEKIISELYDRMLSGECPPDIVLPECPIGEHCLNDYALIKEDAGTVTAYIPTEFIFTNNYLTMPEKKWGNICIAAHFTHINFFRYLNNQADSRPEDYLYEFCIYCAGMHENVKITTAWKNNVIENRTQVFEQMRDALDLDPDFFIRNCASAEWNQEKKYFNLLSGKHRCCFQAAMGKRFIPLKMQKADYDAFLHASVASEVAKSLEDINVEVIIPHPYFYRGPFSRDRGEWQFLLWFARYYGERLYKSCGEICFKRLSIVDMSHDYGNFARFAARLGCEVDRLLSQGPLEEQIGQLLYSTVKYPTSEDFSSTEGLVVVLEAGDLYERMDRLEAFLTNRNNSFVLKSATDEVADRFARDNDMWVVTQSNGRYEKEILLNNYLLEKRNDVNYEHTLGICQPDHL